MAQNDHMFRAGRWLVIGTDVAHIASSVVRSYQFDANAIYDRDGNEHVFIGRLGYANERPSRRRRSCIGGIGLLF
jgi:hypothetical protein